MEKKKKRLTDKQRIALELLTNGQGLSYKAIAEQVGVNQKTLWEWRNSPAFVNFQEELERINNDRWLATVDAARQAAFELCKDKNQRMVEFILKNEGYTPIQKVEAELTNDININIE